jgi:CPA2 family monovalent cation:H+ antiporter-2
MSHELHFIVNVAAAVAIALVGGLIAYRLKQSVIVGYLVAGMAIGPFTPGFVGDRTTIASLAEVGVLFLMFALGIEFSLKELARVRTIAVVGTFLQVGLTITAGLALGMAIGWPFAQGLFFGAIIAISSTMVILKTLIDRGEVASDHGRVLLSMLIVQDLIVIVLIVLLPGLATGSVTALGDVSLTVAKATLFTVLTVFLGVRVVPRMLAAVERLGSSELFLLTAVGLALGASAVSALIGLSPALGAFLGGILLTESEFDHRVIAEVVPMRDFFATLFFVSVGMLIDPRFIVENMAAVIGLAIFIMVTKVLLTSVALMPFQMSGKTLTFASLGMLQIGEFSYVLAQAGRTSGAISETLQNLILTSSLITIVLTPAAFWIAPRVDLALARVPVIGRRFGTRITVIDASDILDQHAVVVGYGRVGQQVVAGLHAAGLPVIVIDEDSHRVHALHELGITAILGDASYRVIMQAARVEQARLVVIALPDAGATRAVTLNARRANPTVPILARVAQIDHDDEIKQAGATVTVAPERAGAQLLLEESAHVLALPVDAFVGEMGAAPRTAPMAATEPINR